MSLFTTLTIVSGDFVLVGVLVGMLGISVFVLVGYGVCLGSDV